MTGRGICTVAWIAVRVKQNVPLAWHFGEIMEQARAIYELNTNRPAEEKFWRRFAFKEILPHRKRLDFIFGVLWLYQRLGVRWLARKSGLFKLMGKLGEAELIMPNIADPYLKAKLQDLTPSKGKTRYRVGFISGCIMNQVFTETNLATIRVLIENGCDVVTPPRQNCCGALHVHNASVMSAWTSHDKILMRLMWTT